MIPSRNPINDRQVFRYIKNLYPYMNTYSLNSLKNTYFFQATKIRMLLKDLILTFAEIFKIDKFVDWLATKLNSC